MRRFLLYSIIGLFVGVFLIGLAFLRGLSDFDLSAYAQQEITFETDQGVLSGTLILPEGVLRPPVALFVHGDGPQDRFSSDGYLIPMRLLLEAGVGVFSWDKPGIGASEGDWLSQSMTDRAAEVVAALRAVQQLDTIDANKLGFLGFSQAGWVVPEAVGPGSTAAFAILVGGAVNWEEQGAYYARQRRAREIPRAPMSPERLAFVERNRGSDARAALPEISVPFLALYGAGDLNVDPDADSATYRQLVAPLRQDNEVVVVPHATHGLLRAPLFNYQLVSQWPEWLPAVFVMAGRYAFAPDVWQQMADWIYSVVPTDP
ncbi:MAG: prolyl oligopeptidase family serine peptidase [Rhodobiaceae bacterium]|nr:prolyl oligopeptidase family serine peptidase [Rhodobiaceae bacterium]